MFGLNYSLNTKPNEDQFNTRIRCEILCARGLSLKIVETANIGANDLF